MPLRFRSFAPYTLPGVLALIGWWWYVSRKKARIGGAGGGIESDDGKAPGLGSPSEGSNGMVEKSCPPSVHHRTGRDRPKAREQRPAEQAVEAQVHVPAAAPETLAAAPPPSERTQSGPEQLTEDSPEPVQHHPALKDGGAPQAPGPASISSEAVEVSGEEEVRRSAAAEGSGAAELHVSRTAGVEEAVAAVAVELAKAERPEPEGEVAADVAAPPENLQVAKDSPAPSPTLTKDEPPAEPPRQDSPPLRPETLETSGARDLPRAEDGEAEALEQLAAGLISEVITAATREFRTAGGCESPPTADRPAGSSTPLVNGRPRLSSDARSEDGAWHSPSQLLVTQESAASPEVPNGCPAAPAWETSENGTRTDTVVGSRFGQAEVSPVLSKLRSEEGAAGPEDSGCSTCQSEDGVSGEDLLHSTGLSQSMPDSRGDLIRVSGISLQAEKSPAPVPLEEETLAKHTAETNADDLQVNGTALRNGAHAPSEAEADQSGGSDVNSMDSVDSGCTLGAGEGQQRGSHAQASQSSELVVWEIEVPKHLVGRLIGKQGRYVSFLKQSSGAKIYISTLPYTQEFQICHIEGTQQQVDKALSLIGKKFKDLDLTNLYAPPPLPLTLPSLPMTSWLLLPTGVTVEVIVVNIVSPGHMFVQQHTHPTYHALRSLDQQMFLCYSQPGTPALPSPTEVGVICAAPAMDGAAWWRAQVISFLKDSNEVEIRYVDYGGYDRVKIDTLRQIRSDFVTLPFQGTEVLLDNLAPLPGEDRFSTEGNAALEEMTRGVPLLAQVTNYDNNTGLPMVQMWNMVGDELVLLNRTLAERGFGSWVDSF
uniref:Tudor domain-containing protein n=1 Tax=Denticeps clupeoides TaxID=299321 RepID=A0AAY4C9S3_9TELE